MMTSASVRGIPWRTASTHIRKEAPIRILSKDDLHEYLREFQREGKRREFTSPWAI